MIVCYTGVPGSGKSLHAIKKVLAFLAAGKNVIGNFPIKCDLLKEKEKNGRYCYIQNEDITVDFLYQFKEKYHSSDEESQTLLIIDEASIKFNVREANRNDRMSFLTFFAQHRKFGFAVILICQNLRQLDRQIRDCIEVEIIHRKTNNMSVFRFLPFPLFVAVEKNMTIKEKTDHEFFFYNKRYGNLYDTFYDFNLKDNENIIITAEFEEKLNNSLLIENAPLPSWGARGTQRRSGGIFNKIKKLFNFDKKDIFEDDLKDEDDLFFDGLKDSINLGGQCESINDNKSDDVIYILGNYN